MTEPDDARSERHASELQEDEILALFKPVTEGILHAMGPGTEVVLHDFRRPDSSIIAIAGNVTGRAVGDSVSAIGLALIAQGSDAEDLVNYSTRTADNVRINSTTLLIRRADKSVIGALCINSLDKEDPARVEVEREPHGVQKTPTVAALPDEIDFSGDIHRIVRTIIEDVIRNEGSLGTKAGRLRVVEQLNDRGVFAVQKAAQLVADYLEVSRATVYNYLEEIASSNG